MLHTAREPLRTGSVDGGPELRGGRNAGGVWQSGQVGSDKGAWLSCTALVLMRRRHMQEFVCDLGPQWYCLLLAVSLLEGQLL